MPGESHGQRSRLHGAGKESDTTEQLTHTATLFTRHHSRPPLSRPLVVSFYFDSFKKKKKKFMCYCGSSSARSILQSSSQSQLLIGQASVHPPDNAIAGTQWKLTKYLVDRFLRLSQTTPNPSIWTQSHPSVLAAISKCLLDSQTSNLTHQGHSKPNPSSFPNKFLQSSEIIWVT